MIWTNSPSYLETFTPSLSDCYPEDKENQKRTGTDEAVLLIKD